MNNFNPSGFMRKVGILDLAPGIATMKGGGTLAIGLEFDRRVVTTKSGATGGRSCSESKGGLLVIVEGYR
jgi:hypothetical protein